MPCSISTTIVNGFKLFRLENEFIALTLIPDKGADIYQWIYKPFDVDVLWKSPWGLGRHRNNPSTAPHSQAAWMDGYAGGWQVLFPSGGGPCRYKGIELNFHGEASVTAWDVVDFSVSSDAAQISLSDRLARSPFSLERTITVEANATSFLLEESITNEGNESMDYMWGHHPAYGSPFLSGSTRVDTNATTITFDEELTSEVTPAAPASSFDWPLAGPEFTDLSVVPAPNEERMTMAYLHEFADEAAWYAMTNVDLNVGAGLVWSRDAFPCAWFWQEMNASSGYPWYKGEYVMAIEPNTSFPGNGLTAMTSSTGMQRTLQPGENAAIELRAVMFESRRGADSIDKNGSVSLKT